MLGKHTTRLFFLFTLLSLPFGVAYSGYDNYAGFPRYIEAPGEKVIIFDPRIHAWAAYSANGSLVRTGLASGGKDYCEDMDSPCRTETGTFRIRSLGSSSCKSPSFPIPYGGSPMPYCMYFNDVQALHGSNHVVRGNISHGCVRLHVGDARWLRNNFAEIGTLVVIRPY